MNSKFKILLAVLLIVLVPGLVLAQESEPKTGTEGEIEVGIWDTTVDGSPDVVLEYEPDGTGPITMITMTNPLITVRTFG